MQCEELLRQEFGEGIMPALKRTIAIPKSAGRADRPLLSEHVRSLGSRLAERAAS